MRNKRSENKLCSNSDAKYKTPGMLNRDIVAKKLNKPLVTFF